MSDFFVLCSNSLRSTVLVQRMPYNRYSASCGDSRKHEYDFNALLDRGINKNGYFLRGLCGTTPRPHCAGMTAAGAELQLREIFGIHLECSATLAENSLLFDADKESLIQVIVILLCIFKMLGNDAIYSI